MELLQPSVRSARDGRVLLALGVFAVVFLVAHALPPLAHPRAEALVPAPLRGGSGWGLPHGWRLHETLDMCAPVAVAVAVYALLSAMCVADSGADGDGRGYTHDYSDGGRFAGGYYPVPAVAWGLLCVVMAQGHGMHLAGNAVDRFAWRLRDAADADQRQLWALNYFFDETAGHHIWYAAEAGLCALAMWVQAVRPCDGTRGGLLLHALAVAHGVLSFFGAVEGQTVTLGAVNAVTAVCARAVLWGEQRRVRSYYAPDARAAADAAGDWPSYPVCDFFAVASAVCLALLAAWYHVWGGFPEFKVLGLGAFYHWPGNLWAKYVVGSA